MFKTLPFAIALAATLSVLVPQAADAAPGYRTTHLEVEHRAVPLQVHIWYPSDGTGPTSALGKNAAFTGVEVRREAAPKPGPHPLVLLSHGSGGNAVNIAWIAAALADRGMVVAAVNHPGTTSGDSDPRQTVRIWDRPADLTAVLDAAIAGGFDAIEVDETRVGAVGFSLGGHTALSIAGATVDKAKYIGYCKRYPEMLDCAWLAAGGIDLQRIDAGLFEKSNRDARIMAVVAVDPAFAQAYDLASLNAISMPVRLINLGEHDQVPAVVNAAGIADAFANAELSHVEQATHFSFLGECTERGEAIIKSEGEEPICSETGDRKRADIHGELKAQIGAFLQKELVDK